MEIISEEDAFVVMANTDNTEGRGFHYPICISKSYSVCERHSLKRYVQGTNCPIYPTKVFKIKDDLGIVALYGVIKMEYPTNEDNKKDEARERKSRALTKAKSLGMNDSDINDILAT